jgi:hypothetical protein
MSFDIKINRAKIHCFYYYKDSKDPKYKCSLCRLDIMNSINNNITKGVCGHLFHTHCINQYLKSGKLSCPVDFTAWKTQANYINGINHAIQDDISLYLPKKKAENKENNKKKSKSVPSSPVINNIYKINDNIENIDITIHEEGDNIKNYDKDDTINNNYLQTKIPNPYESPSGNNKLNYFLD